MNRNQAENLVIDGETDRCALQRDFDVEDMQRFAREAWGEIGANMVNKWSEFNERYFGSMLRPIPIIITPTLPYGRSVADCSGCGEHGRLIRVNLPKDHNVLVADYNTLLHEMVHQILFERQEYPEHDGTPWCREIMRLTKMITGKEIWAGRYKTVRRKKSEGGDGRVIRINEPAPDGRPSLKQEQITHWPHKYFGINLGRLGE